MPVDKKEYVSKRHAARILGVGFKSVDPICSKNRVKVWQLPGSKFKFYRNSDLQRILSAADLACETGAGA